MALANQCCMCKEGIENADNLLLHFSVATEFWSCVFFFFFWVHRGVLCGAVQSDQLFFCWKGQFHWHSNSGVHDRHYVLGGSRIAAFFMELRDL